MDPYGPIAEYYDLEHAELLEDIQLYLNLVVAGPVLEMGAGTGRIAEALARAGHEVWAVDRSDAMLERAKKRADDVPKLHLVQANSGELSPADLPLSFRVAILSLNFLWHLPGWEDQVAALREVHRHVVRSALVVVDLTNPLSMSDRGADGEVRRRFEAPYKTGTLVGSSAAWDDAAEQRLRLHLTYDEIDGDGLVHRSSTNLSLKYIYRAELELMLQTAGFQLEILYGSYDLEPYGAGSPNLIAVCRAEKD
jgi:SAM-dependent methyltransferase